MLKCSQECFNKALGLVLEYIVETVVSRVKKRVGSTRTEETGGSESNDADTLKRLKFRVKELVDTIGKDQAYAKLREENAFYNKDSKESDLKKTVKVLEDLLSESDGESDVDTPF